MPPDPLQNLSTHMVNFFDRTVGTVGRQTDELSQHMFGMSARSIMDNLLKGGDPSMGAATQGIEPEQESFGIQMVASILAPGIPGGPIFRGAKDLLNGLKRVPTERLLRLKDDAATSMGNAVRGPTNQMQSPSGSGISSRAELELDVLNDAIDIETIQRAKRGDTSARRFLDAEYALDFGGEGSFFANKETFFDMWEMGATSRIEQTSSFLELLDGLGLP